MTHKLISTVLILLFSCVLSAQSLPDSTRNKIDQLFARWNTPNEPGCVAGIVQNGQLVYAKGFGLANLENKTPNTPATVFYMCSVSKQFAGYAIAILVNEGKIKLEEDIRTYLPWMSDFGGKKIKVSNLLSHTSGIRDDIGLSQYFGLGMDGMLTQQQAILILRKQHTLNFNPGEKFSYSNSNYVLLAEIVKSVTGKSLREYADSAIFKPLGMTATQFVDDPAMLIPDRASSYERVPANERAPSYEKGSAYEKGPSYEKDGKAFRNSLQNVYTLGDGGLFTNVDDMAKWVNNFFDPKAGNQQDIALMTTPGKLGDGTSITYGMGIDVTTDRGYKRLIHNGSLAGYRTIIAIYPELKTGIFIFGNGGDRSVENNLNDIAALLMPDRSEKKESPITISKTATVPAAGLMKWTGNYLADNGYKVVINFKEGKLYVNENMELVPEGQDVFHLAARASVKYQFYVNPTTNVCRTNLVSPALAKPMELTRIKEVVLSAKELAMYAGTYWSDELEMSFTVMLKGDQLWINDKYHEPVKVTLLGRDHLFTGYDHLSHVHVVRDGKGGIRGFELNSGGMANLYFYRK